MNSEARGDAFNKNLSAKLQSLDQINKDIDSLEKRISTLRDQRSEIEQQIAIARASIAPIGKIPNEILSSIFLYVMAPYLYGREGLTLTYRDRASLLLVCKSWRNVVVNDPRLWNGILVTEPRGISTVEQVNWVERAKTYLGLCLSRSKSVSLDVVIDLTELKQGHCYVGDIIEREFRCLDDEGGFEGWDMSPLIYAYDELVPEVLRFLVGELGENMNRWCSLYLMLPAGSEFPPPIFTILNRRCLALRNVYLSGEFEESDLSGLSLLLRSSRELELSWDVSLSDVPHLPLLSSLTLTIDAEFDWETFEHIREFPQLKDLTIEVIIGEHSAPDVDTISLPELDHLHLFGPFPRTVFQAFECKRLPKLSIDDELFEDNPSLEAKLFARVQTLVYVGPRYRPEKFARKALLGMLPQLETVHMIQLLHPLIEDALSKVASNRKKGHLRNLRTILARDEKSGLRDEIYSLPIVT